jgi:hypothetical protein
MKNTASEIKNLSENEAIQKFKELVDHDRFVSLPRD